MIKPVIVIVSLLHGSHLSVELYHAAAHLWVFDKHNASPIEGLGLLHMRRAEVKGLTIFLGFILSPTGISSHTLSSERPTKVHSAFSDAHSGSLQTCCPKGEGVCIWRVQLKPNNMYSLKTLKPKLFGILHISYPKIWATIFIEKWVIRSNFQFNIVLYNLGQRSLDSKFFSFW